MLGLVLRRLAAFPLLLLAMYGGAAALVSATPGELFDAGERDLPADVLQQKLRALNFDQPWVQRVFVTWPRRLLWDGDLPSLKYEDWTVVEILRSALPISLQLGVFALGLAILLGITTGVLSAVGGRTSRAAFGALSLAGISVPTFVIGAGLLLVFGLWLRAVPVGGWGRPAQVLLPALTLALPYAAYIARLTRAGLQDVYREEYIRTARAVGLSETRILLDHALRNALLPVISYLGPAAAAIFTGSFVVEKVFAIPGLGTHVVESIHNRDQTLILSIVLIYGSMLAGFNLLVDLLYAWVDPRVRVGAGSA